MGLDRLRKLIESLDRIEIRAGLLREEGGAPKKVRTGGPGEPLVTKEDPTLTVARVAAWNEYGTPTAPARPAWRTTKDQPETADAVRQAQEAVRGLLLNPNERPDGQVASAAEPAAKRVAKALQTSIDQWASPANAAATIKRKGFNDPLVDTGQERDSIRYEVTLNGRRVVKGSPE